VRRTVTMVVAFSLYVAGCASPEASRTRGGGHGADVGNRTDVVEMHEGSKPFYETPRLVPTAHPSLAPASQAADLSHR